ncbi:hypothetical protein J2X03_003771 [Microbacterium trichothecenolyticum]|uniref:hypothetical protein n=1 Tax=Microbacterium trichothecenolyticum TaxID=69370 RepID=UPI00285CE645|nr:hypothetical protein [Microbacterium trichothecenolyticum]MDR7113869.1 hypothetical protein [Microbacterium trichothecenolyticum]
MTNKLVLWVGGVLAVLLVATIVLVIVLINTVSAQAEDQRYQDCMARHGYAVDEPPPAVNTDDELDTYLEQISGAAEECMP